MGGYACTATLFQREQHVCHQQAQAHSFSLATYSKDWKRERGIRWEGYDIKVNENNSHGAVLWHEQRLDKWMASNRHEKISIHLIYIFQASIRMGYNRHGVCLTLYQTCSDGPCHIHPLLWSCCRSTGIVSIYIYIYIQGERERVAYSKWRNVRFHPEKLYVAGCTSVAVIFAELCFTRLGCYFLNIPFEASMLDLIAYSGYKYVCIIVTDLAKLLGAGKWLFWIVFLYTASSVGFFLVRTFFGVQKTDKILMGNGNNSCDRCDMWSYPMLLQVLLQWTPRGRGGCGSCLQLLPCKWCLCSHWLINTYTKE